MQLHIRTLIWLLAIGSVAAPARVALSGDLNRFPEYASEPAPPSYDASQIEDLKELLRQAQELQKNQDKSKPAPPAKADADPAAKSEGAEGEDAEPEKKAVVRPGCMYRGRTLIWEKVPGSCR